MKHDFFKEDCYHTASRPFGYCGYEKYICRNCGETHSCAMYLPPEILNGKCKREQAG